MDIRRITAGDPRTAEALGLYDAAFDPSFRVPIERLRMLLDRRDGLVVYGAFGDGLEGMAIVLEGRYWLVQYMTVRKESRRSGIGRALISRITDDARSAGAGGILAETAKDTIIRMAEENGYGIITHDYALPIHRDGGYTRRSLLMAPFASHSREGMMAALRSIWQDHYRVPVPSPEFHTGDGWDIPERGPARGVIHY